MSDTSSHLHYRRLPAVDMLLRQPPLVRAARMFGQDTVTAQARLQLAALRAAVTAGETAVFTLLDHPDYLDRLGHLIEAAVKESCRNTLVPVFNLTGTVIHTNLGRASLPVEAVRAMEAAATENSSLEYDLIRGERGDRDLHIETVLREITGAEAATVVNNNAAAVLLILNTLAAGREVLISRGELLEIGGSFRIPEVMASAGSVLKEVGTTNRTYLGDYESAMTSETALVMKVHRSNYHISGFVHSVAESELAGMARARNCLFATDLGSGTLTDLRQFGLPYESTVMDSLANGANLVCFSGDKLLGGPQAGIIVGDRDLVDRLKCNPLKRALRMDKIGLAGLTQVLMLYRSPENLPARLPVLRDLTRTLSSIEQMAQRLLPRVKDALKNVEVSLAPCKSQIGSGALPMEFLDSAALAMAPAKADSDEALQQLALALRALPKPVIGRLHDGRLLLDLRCLRNEEEFIRQLDLVHHSL
ncbi:MAG: L-seryl-tRNA(Sec) selenium transferase [Pseudohongiellaceae bacterium]